MNDEQKSDQPLPHWAQPGPTVYATLMREALAQAVTRPDILQDYVPPRFARSVLGEVDAALSRAYVQGTQYGFTRAAQLFDEQAHIPDGAKLISQEEYDQMKRDMQDMSAARQTVFERCPGCGRIREKGMVCPTNSEGGECVEGK